MPVDPCAAVRYVDGSLLPEPRMLSTSSCVVFTSTRDRIALRAFIRRVSKLAGRRQDDALVAAQRAKPPPLHNFYHANRLHVAQCRDGFCYFRSCMGKNVATVGGVRAI